MAELPPGVDPSKVPLYPPPAGLSSNFIDPPSLASVAEGVGGLLIAVETLLLILRTASNLTKFHKLRLEDYWTIFAAVLTYGYFALLMRLRSLARHQWDIPLTEDNPGTLKTIFAFQMMLGPTSFFAKSSLLLLYYRIFSSDDWFRYKLYAAFAFLAVTTLPSVPLNLALCLPPRNGSWDTATINCDKTGVWYYVQGPTSVIFDLFALYLPASVIVHLHMPLQRKLGVLAIFMTGTLALIASIISLVYRIRFVHYDNDSWSGFINIMCLLIEPCVSIICCCMPALPAISKLIFDKGTFMSLRSRLRGLYAWSKRSKSSDGTGVSRRKAFPCGSGRSKTKDSSNAFGSYIPLVDGGGRSSTTTLCAESQRDPGIHKSVELEISSRAKTVQSQESGQV